jgi:hypothetical protein
VALTVPPLVYEDVSALSAAAYASPAGCLTLPPTPALSRATGALLGYFAFDMLVLCGLWPGATWRQMLKSNGRGGKHEPACATADMAAAMCIISIRVSRACR